MRTEVSVSGIEYLDLVTELLHVTRLTDPLQGLWEAADLQWWWRRDQHQVLGRQTFLMDGNKPVAAVILTDWGGRFQIDLLFSTLQHAGELKQLWPKALDLIETVGLEHIEFEIPSIDEDLTRYAIDAGFRFESNENWTCWMPASERPTVKALPNDFVLRSRTEVQDRPHPMAERNGKDFEERLSECSLYNPDLDLAVYNTDGEVAGYSLFWADPITKVGLVEPMRTNEKFQAKGIARGMLAIGLERLSQSGCRRIKVSAASPLYLSAGFRATSSSHSLAKN
jgi:hypothetical protein